MTDQENKPQSEQPERQPYYDEKTEEKLEKGDEKQEEKHNQDPLNSLIWALILIWAGLVFLAANLGWLDQLKIAPLGIEGITIPRLSTYLSFFSAQVCWSSWKL